VVRVAQETSAANPHRSSRGRSPRGLVVVALAIALIVGASPVGSGDVAAADPVPSSASRPTHTVTGRGRSPTVPGAGSCGIFPTSNVWNTRVDLTTALHQTVAHKQPKHYRGLRVRVDESFVTADLTVRPVDAGGGRSSDLYLVVLEQASDSSERAGSTEGEGPPPSPDRVTELERELRAKEDYLQTTLEEMEATNEELKSTNEEMQSINEELQSTNEELETSKEELQSVNEEISTVNAELQDKLAELSRATNDMNNLLAGTGIGTVFVDNQLRILRFTPSATQVINLIASDVGRPVGHIVPNLVGYSDLVDDIREVLDTLSPKEAEVVTKGGATYLMRIRPYRTVENTIEGVVLTFVDISQLKRAELALKKSEERFHSIFNQAFAGVAEIDRAGRFVYLNDRFCEMTGFSRKDLLEMTMQDLTHPEERIRATVFFRALGAGGPDFSIEKRYRCRDGSAVWVSERVSGIRDADGEIKSAVAVSFDLTERKRLQREAAAVDARLESELSALARLEGIGSLTITPENRDGVYEEILDAALAINQGEMGTLQLTADGARPGLYVAAARGLDKDYVDFWNAAFIGGGTWTNALRGGEPIVVEDVAQSPLFVGTPALEIQLQAGVRALQSVPLLGSDGAMLGVLTTHFRMANRPEPRRLRMFDILAQQVSDILQRERDGSAKGTRSR
jgi:PAS domain S-box-containing protein